MKAVVRVIVLVLLMSTLAFEHGHAADDEFYKTRVIENMKLASTWIIENGVNVFSEDGKPGIHRKLVDEWGVQIWGGRSSPRWI